MVGQGRAVFVSPNRDVVVARSDDGFSVVESLGGEGFVRVEGRALGDCDARGGETIRVERQALDAYVRASCVIFGQAVSIARLTGGGRSVGSRAGTCSPSGPPEHMSAVRDGSAGCGTSARFAGMAGDRWIARHRWSSKTILVLVGMRFLQALSGRSKAIAAITDRWPLAHDWAVRGNGRPMAPPTMTGPTSRRRDTPLRGGPKSRSSLR